MYSVHACTLHCTPNNRYYRWLFILVACQFGLDIDFKHNTSQTNCRYSETCLHWVILNLHNSVRTPIYPHWTSKKGGSWAIARRTTDWRIEPLPDQDSIGSTSEQQNPGCIRRWPSRNQAVFSSQSLKSKQGAEESPSPWYWKDQKYADIKRLSNKAVVMLTYIFNSLPYISLTQISRQVSRFSLKSTQATQQTSMKGRRPNDAPTR